MQAEAIQDAVAETRRYAKRQLTWLRARMADWTWADPEMADPDELLRRAER